MSFNEPLQCDGFVATLAYKGYAYGDTWYEVSAVVATLTQAIKTVEAIRAAMRKQKPRLTADAAEPRLVASDWRGNPVSVVLSYTSYACCARCDRPFLDESDAAEFGDNWQDYARSKTHRDVCWSCLTYNEQQSEREKQ